MVPGIVRGSTPPPVQVPRVVVRGAAELRRSPAGSAVRVANRTGVELLLGVGGRVLVGVRVRVRVGVRVGVKVKVQLSPFPYQEVREQLERWPRAQVVWAQEEAMNYGAWNYV